MRRNTGKGWFLESKRHSLASRGIKTSVKECPESRVKVTKEENQINVREYSSKNIFPIQRVPYGKEGTPKEDWEYKIEGVQSPVGNISDWKTYAKQNGYKIVRVMQKDGSVDFVFVD
jgi:hypothetical protein